MNYNVAVVVPYYKASLTADEEQSWRHLEHYLGCADVILMVPTGLEIPSLGLQKREFANHFFNSTASYSRLLLTKQFYEQFNEFEYVLIYQLDCLVLSSNLATWCRQDWSYIGAPIFRSISDPNSGFSRIGNGGLSLRNVAAALRVLTSDRSPSLRAVWGDVMPDVPMVNIKKRLQVIRAAQYGVGWYTDHYTLNEDLFWSDRARLFDPSFSIAPIKAGLQFSFDAHPSYCFKENDCRLPFGVHAWAKWDYFFWLPYLL